MTFMNPVVMGIVNVTPDSFYSASRVQAKEDILQRVRQLREEGAAIVDIGGYSTRPGAEAVTPEEEYHRLAVGLEVIRREWEDAVVSVDTFRAEIARRCVSDWDVDIINDVGGGELDPGIWDVVAEMGVAYVLMHMRGTPDTMSSLTRYEDVSADVLSILAKRVATLRQSGVANIIIDPGFGFAKDLTQNYRLLADLEMFHIENAPVLAGVSRKRMVWMPLGTAPEEAANGTTVLNTIALMNSADILRVHDVKAAVEAVRLFDLYNSSKVR